MSSNRTRSPRRWGSRAAVAAADSVLAAASFAAALFVRELYWSASAGEALNGALEPLTLWGLFPAALVPAVFAALGLYTRARNLPLGPKLGLVARGVAVAYGLFLFTAYVAAFPAAFEMPRSALLIAFGVNLAAALGARAVKARVRESYHIQPRRPNLRSRPERVLVIGGAGYIGSVLTRRLLRSGYQVRVFDRLAFGAGALAGLEANPDFELVEGDMRDVNALVRAAQGVDAVVLLGAIVGDPACALDEKLTIETNYAATALAAEVCKGVGVGRLVFASTCSVYGAAAEVVDEGSELNPVSLYARTKIDSERILLAARSETFHPTILRLGTAFGWSHRPRFDLVVNLLTAKTHFDGEIVIYNGEQWRPFVHIADISKAVQLALEAPTELVSGEIFNVGSDGMNHRLGDVGRTLAALDPTLVVRREENSDARTYRVSFEKIRTTLGFETDRTLEDGIGEMLGHIRSGRVADYTEPIYHNHKSNPVDPAPSADLAPRVSPLPLALALERLAYRTPSGQMVETQAS